MLTIYGSDLSGPAIKVRLTASYVGLDYKWHLINLREKEQKQDWFLNINPVGKVPAIDDNGFCLFESNACCRYLADKANSTIYPKDPKKRAVIEQWIDFISFHIAAHGATVTYNRVFAPRRNLPVNEQAVAEALKFLDQYVPIIEKQLSRHKHVAGDELTLADLVLFATLEPCEVAQISLAAYPKLAAWREGLKQQPFYTKCYREYGETLKK